MPESLASALKNILYPAHCFICSRLLTQDIDTNPVCQNCYDKILLNLPGFCKKCGLGGQTQGAQYCSACKGKKFNFRRAFSACVYEEPIKTLIHLFKYDSRLKLRKLFAEIFIKFLRDYKISVREYDLFVAVPMHPTRLREREFNHSQVLAQDLAVEFNVPISSGDIERSRYGRPQMSLSERERMENIKGAFRLRHRERFSNKNILIIDDVFTTGSTVCEIALILNECNAKGVDVLTLARSVQKEFTHESN